MTHAEFGPVNLGHGPVESFGAEVVAIADPNRAASPTTERRLRTGTLGPQSLQALTLTSDVADLATGAEPERKSTFVEESRIAGKEVETRANNAIGSVAEAISLSFPEWLPTVVGSVVATIVLALLAIAFGQLFNVNLG